MGRQRRSKGGSMQAGIGFVRRVGKYIQTTRRHIPVEAYAQGRNPCHHISNSM